jgi:hypothetical protein
MVRQVGLRFSLLVIVLGGLGLRTWNLNFDQGLNSHPDERWTTCWMSSAVR